MGKVERSWVGHPSGSEALRSAPPMCRLEGVEEGVLPSASEKKMI